MGFANRDSKGWDSREGYRNQKWDVFGWIPDDWSGNKNDKVTKEEPKDNKLAGETELSQITEQLRQSEAIMGGIMLGKQKAMDIRDYNADDKLDALDVLLLIMIKLNLVHKVFLETLILKIGSTVNLRTIFIL